MLLILISILVFLLMLSLLVFVHEAGHFFVAKFSGVHVEEFGFGIPPRALGVKVGDTIYSLNWLPIGGFVKLYGEDEAGAGRVNLASGKPSAAVQGSGKVWGVTNSNTAVPTADQAFTAKPMANRIAIVVAGVFMNLLLAIFLYYIVLAAHGFSSQVSILPQAQNPHFIGATQQKDVMLVVDEVAPKTPAQQAGILANDQVIAVNGKKLLSSDSLKQAIDANAGKPITISLKNAQNQERTVTVTPRVNPPPEQGALGIAYSEIDTTTLLYKTPLQKVFAGFSQTYNIGVYSFEVFGKLLGVAVQQHNAAPVREGVAGPVGIWVIVKDLVGNKAIYALVEFTALLSLNLAVVNILPFPALDGGRLLFLLIEAVTRRKITPRVEQVINTAGMALLLCLILAVTYNDLLRIF